VVLYLLSPSQTSLVDNKPPFFAIKAGSGPRHLAFDPAGHFAYVINEMSSTLTCCAYSPASGELKEIQTVSILPEKHQGANSGAEVQMHPSGRFLYASNRGDNSIAVFDIDPRTGTVRLAQTESTRGKTPRHFCLDPSARWLIAENQDSDSVAIFSIDSATGHLTATGQSEQISASVCAVFVQKQAK